LHPSLDKFSLNEKYHKDKKLRFNYVYSDIPDHFGADLWVALNPDPAPQACKSDASKSTSEPIAVLRVQVKFGHKVPIKSGVISKLVRGWEQVRQGTMRALGTSNIVPVLLLLSAAPVSDDALDEARKHNVIVISGK